ncbi:aminoglycoside adenylyltransferase family protein [Pseudomonadota bacterium AL_CKDN230030165-1A_HGKHYDSX7]
MIPALPAAITVQLAQTRALLDAHLGPRLLALHLLGSAVAGGLRPHSDIDLVATIDAPLADAERGALMQALLGLSAWPGTNPALRALEVTIVVRRDMVPWQYPPRREMQFGEWLRTDIEAGVYEASLADPDLAILLTQARESGIALAGPPAQAWFEPVPQADLVRALRDTMAQWNGPDDWAGDELTVVLALARIDYSAHTGRIVPKDVAAAWALERLPARLRPLLAQASAAYLGDHTEPFVAEPGVLADYVRHMRGQAEALLAGPPDSARVPGAV